MELLNLSGAIDGGEALQSIKIGIYKAKAYYKGGLGK